MTKKHYVTPAQLVESAPWPTGMSSRFRLRRAMGRIFTWSGMSRAPDRLSWSSSGRTARVVWSSSHSSIGWACRYHDVAEFAGVIDAGCDAALAYASANKTPYRVLADPDREIIDRFGAKNSGYVALLRPGGAIESVWPGCSAEMMRALGRLALPSWAPSRSIVPSMSPGCPEALTTGCPFRTVKQRLRPSLSSLRSRSCPDSSIAGECSSSSGGSLAGASRLCWAGTRRNVAGTSDPAVPM